MVKIKAEPAIAQDMEQLGEFLLGLAADLFLASSTIELIEVNSTKRIPAEFPGS